ncbi:hypothetical protein HYT32_02120 [Candidatus Roizmanbacteria bacterium]|nr:hypothetical protein [Candidatus Roizmanbacteria bacterium]
MERLDRAKEMADKWLNEEGVSNFPALSVAYRLAFYNLIASDDPNPKSFELLSNRLRHLADKEKAFSDPENPFPTTGIEIEVPRKVVPNSDFPPYAEFFDKIGMPRNGTNPNSGKEVLGFCWEFSPNPSYYAGTQSRIIAELIKGGFLPSLRLSQYPRDILEYLDSSLVSLHVNLGGIVNREQMQPNYANYDFFSKVFAFAFTSPLRLEHRKSANYLSIKEGEETLKSIALNLGSVGRLEVKALEVRTESTYRLLGEIQLLAGAFFAFLYDKDDFLSQRWQEVQKEAKPLIDTVIEDIYNSSGIATNSTVTKRLAQTTISQELRSLITAHAREIAKRCGV